MKQLLNKYKVNGQVQLRVFDQNNQLVDCIKKKNEVFINGKKAYRDILGLMDDPNYPSYSSQNNEEQINIQSNNVDFFARSGQMPFLQAKLANKHLFKFQKAFRFNDEQFLDNSGNGIGSSIVTHNNRIKDSTDNNFLLNEQIKQNKTTIYNSWDRYNYAFVYAVEENSEYSDDSEYSYNSYNSDISDSSNINQNIQEEKYITGLCIDIKAPQYLHTSFQVAFDYYGEQIKKYVETSELSPFNKATLPPPLIPFSNGSPINRMFSSYQGNAMANDKIYTYVFDMYPRYCIMPKKVILIFNKYYYGDYMNYNYQTMDIQIQKLQFLTHRQPKYGPIAIYFKSEQNNIVATKINKVQVQGNTILYYASLGYDEGNGNTFNTVGLANSINNTVFKNETLLNQLYYDKRIKLFNEPFPDYITNHKKDIFYKRAIADNVSCNNLLIQAKPQSWSFVKNKRNRIDVIYRMNFTFGS